MNRKENPTVITNKVLDLIESGLIDPWVGADLQNFAINRDKAVQEIINDALRSFLEMEERWNSQENLEFAH